MDEVMFDAEHFFDGYKANPDYAMACLAAAEKAGARWLVLCDTNGGTLPHEIERIVGDVVKKIPGERLGIHTHNDTENAVANTLAAVRAGVRQVQGTINGLGERCGNANMIALIPNLVLKMGFETGLKDGAMQRLTHLSRLLDDRLNVVPNRSAAYVGTRAFAHKGGLHVSAVEKDPKTYEHVDPETVGNQRIIVVSDQAGRSNIMARFRQIGLEVDSKDPGVARLLEIVKEREAEGYAYDGADASFELLGAPRAAHRARLLRPAELPRAGRAARQCARPADRALRGDGEARRRRPSRHGSGRGQRPGERAGCCPAEGAAAGLSRAGTTCGWSTSRSASSMPRAERRRRRGS